MTPTREQRAAMAADLAERAALDLRFRKDGRGTGRAVEAMEQAIAVLQSEDAEAAYREGLVAVGLDDADIDASCEAIARGEHPAGSLPGKIMHSRRNALHWNVDVLSGHSAALDSVLDLLGCKVTP